MKPIAACELLTVTGAGDSRSCATDQLVGGAVTGGVAWGITKAFMRKGPWPVVAGLSWGLAGALVTGAGSYSCRP